MLSWVCIDLATDDPSIQGLINIENDSESWQKYSPERPRLRVSYDAYPHGIENSALKKMYRATCL
jgi:hypothetical protein